MKIRTKIIFLAIYLLLLYPMTTFSKNSLYDREQYNIIVEKTDCSPIMYDFPIFLQDYDTVDWFKYILIKDIKDFATVEFEGNEINTTIRGIYGADYSLQRLMFFPSPISPITYDIDDKTTFLKEDVGTDDKTAILKIGGLEKEIVVKKSYFFLEYQRIYYGTFNSQTLKDKILDPNTTYTIALFSDFADYFKIYNKQLNNNELEFNIENIEFDQAIINFSYIEYDKLNEFIKIFEENGYTVIRHVPDFEHYYYWFKGSYIIVVTTVLTIIYINNKKNDEYYQSLLA